MISYHVPVLKNEVIDFLKPHKDGLYVDATLGSGGHAAALLEAVPEIQIIGFDQDPDAVDYVQKTYPQYKDHLLIINKNFSYLSSSLAINRIRKVDGILFDLGISSHQIDARERGFSFRYDEALNMRMDKSNEFTAETVINTYSEEELGRIFREYGEERFWRRIARAIVEKRAIAPIYRTGELYDIIVKAIPVYNKIKSCARIFQAIRIEVNGELDVLKDTLNQAVSVLKPGGRILVISYHSLEDRIVKQFFHYEALSCICPPQFPQCVCDKVQRLKIITKKIVLPTADEISENPRSRSAKLRVAERC